MSQATITSFRKEHEKRMQAEDNLVLVKARGEDMKLALALAIQPAVTMAKLLNRIEEKDPAEAARLRRIWQKTLFEADYTLANPLCLAEALKKPWKPIGATSQGLAANFYQFNWRLENEPAQG